MDVAPEQSPVVGNDPSTFPGTASAAPGFSIESWLGKPKRANRPWIERLLKLREASMAILGLAISLSILAVVIRGLGNAEIRGLLAAAPRAPAFWIAFAAAYVLGPAAEWAIFRRIWAVGASAILPLLRKQVANEIVLGYAGDAQFYVWARRHRGFEGSVFGVVRDVAILSALAGNLATLLIMIAVAPMLYQMATGPILNMLVASAGVIVVTSLAVFAAQRRLALLAMPKRDLGFTFGVHCVRIILCLLLSATMLHLLLPSAGIAMLAVVAALQMMVGRLPLLPAREAVLAALCIVLLGTGSGVAAAMTLIATLIITTHMTVGALAMLGALADRGSGALTPRRYQLAAMPNLRLRGRSGVV